MFKSTVQKITAAGAVLYSIGVFLPIASVRVIGDISYFRVDDVSAILTIVCAALALVMIGMKKEKLTAVPVVALWVVMLWPMLKDMFSGGGDGGKLGDMMGKATDPLADLAGELLSKIDILSLGGIVFVVGLLLVTVGGVMTTVKAK